MSWRETLTFPPETPISAEAHDLITGLLRDAESRLGAQGGLEQFRRHPFFAGLDWTNLRDRPAAIPVHVRSIDDTSNFDEFPDEDLTWRKLSPPVQRSLEFVGKRLIEHCLVVAANVTDPKKSYKKDLAFINYTYKAFDGYSSCDRRLARPTGHQRHVNRPCPPAGAAAPSVG